MNRTDRYILSCPNWDEFYRRTGSLSKADKGRIFERLVQLYLQTTPEYRSILRDVWLLRDVPPKVRQKLKLPLSDEGIDLIARTRRGEYWAVQAKFIGKHDTALGLKRLSTFMHATWNICQNINLAIVAHTSSLPIRKRKLLRDTREIGLDRWLLADWSLIVRNLKGKGVRPQPRKPRPDQLRAITAAKKHFIHNKETRGRLIMPCGTGKSLIAFWTAEALKAKTIVVAVPSLGLIRQSVADWTREFLAKGQKPDWICVCSDDSVGNLERDEIVGEVYDTGLPTHTDPKEIARELRRPGKTKIVFTTYQSGDQLAAAARLAKTKFDLVIFDEAHRTVGAQSKSFATLLRDRSLKTRYRLFMTATERRVNDDVDVFSMDDNEDVYGKRFFTMSFKEAISLGIISNYKILTVAVSDQQVASLIARNRLLNLHRNLDEAEARAVATGIALKRIYKKYGVKHAISFHASILAADRFRAQQDVLNCLQPRAENFHVSSRKSAGERKLRLDEFEQAPRALMTNARCLQEGIDVPAIDCVVFADPKQSATDVIQAAGRAMRRSKGKKYGYVVVPIIVPDRMTFEEFAATTAFRTVVRIITGLSVHDTRIVDELRAIHYGRVSKGKIIKIDGKIPVGMRMSLGRFADAVSVKLWDNVARVNWRSFEEARTYVRALGLKNTNEWKAYCDSGKKPSDIPFAPWELYADSGWAGMGDWLGTANRRGNWRPFEEARAFTRTLGLKDANGWRAYCRSGKKPNDIPVAPWQVYANRGWLSFRDWLGCDWRPFEEARAFARALGVNLTEWKAYCRSGKKPNDIPKSPDTVYAGAGWIDWGDWLGYESRSSDFRPFEEARAFVQKLKLKSIAEWRAYCRSGKKPKDIPAGPESVYADSGWAGFPDWLGSGRLRGGRDGWRPFEEAREFVRGLGFTSQAEWRDYCRSEKKPNDIPSAPWDVYAGAGWESLIDWLGDGRRVSGWRSFEDARSFARSLGFKNYKKWFAYCKSEKKPDDIPAAADRIYADAGWVSWSDWIGTSNRRGGWRSFKEARAFVHKLKLKNVTRDWRAYCKSGKKPDDIPTNPPAVYADAGWAGWGDWLGNGERRRGAAWRDFKDARTFVRALRLESGTEWLAYCKSGKKPDDIPTNPDTVYADDGWTSVADWLGSKRRIGGWRSFKEARAFARRLGLKSNDEWRVYCKSKKKPDDIPSRPDVRYANAGWRGWNDWFGKPEMLPFKKARAFVRTLGLKNSEEWATYCKSEKKPPNIPNTPYQHYADKGWAGWSDWLGNEHRWRSFNKARAFARSLGLKTGSEWWTYCKSGKAPKDIPLCPQSVYAEAGWAGWNDWLGSGRKMLPFKKARAFVRGLKFKSWADWREYCRTGKRPNDIPSTPNIIYADTGWAGWGDWLGADLRRVSNWRGFEEARTFARNLKLNNQKEWAAYCRSGKKPNDIPSTPEKVYAKAGWAGLNDWLGTDIHRRGNSWRPFKEARAFARTLGIKSSFAWLREYARSGKKPNDIPAVPNKAYAEHWVDWSDWLGRAA